MRNRIFVLASIVALVIGATIFAVGQSGAVMAHFQHKGGGPHHSIGPEMVEHIARELNLNEAQKTQVKSLLEAVHTAIASLHQKKSDLDKQLELATANGQFDETSEVYSESAGPLMVEQSSSTNEQKAKSLVADT